MWGYDNCCIYEDMSFGKVWVDLSDMDRRAINIAKYLVDNNCSLRAVAREFCVGKSTVWSDIQKVRSLDSDLYHEASVVLNRNRRKFYGW